MLADKAKKSKLAETGQDVDSDPVDGELVLSIEKLQEVQDELEKVNEEASDKVLEVEQKYNEIRKPVYDRRNEIIKTIPDFWLTAFLSHPALCDLLTEEDQKIFKYLNSLDVEDFKDVKLGYSITFNFRENPYFDDSKLTKAFSFFDDGTTKISGTTIKWKEGMVLLMEYMRLKEPNVPLLARGICLVNSLSYVVESQKDCFFRWFSETQQKDLAEFGDEIAEIIKEDLWPNPLKYFNNEADEEDMDGDEDGEEENGDDEEEENGEDSSE